MIFQILLKKNRIILHLFLLKISFFTIFLKNYDILLHIFGNQWCQVVIDGKNTYPKEQSFFYYFAQGFK